MREAIVNAGAVPVLPGEPLRVMALLEWGVLSSLERREMACTALEP
jgi:hypothetical protein